MIPRPDGSYENQCYACLAQRRFEQASEYLRDKAFTQYYVQLLDRFLKEVRDQIPFEFGRRSNEPRRQVSCMQAFGTRIPVWKVIDRAVASEPYIEGNDTREERIDSFIKLLPDVVRFIEIRALLIETDRKFAEMKYPTYLYDAMSSSEILAENAGKPLYEKVMHVVEKIAVDLKKLCDSSPNKPPCATQEEPEEFFRESPQNRRLCCEG